jgi:hypothetical protein
MNIQVEGCQILLYLGDNLYIAKAPIENLREQDVNARVMNKAMFEQLTSNIAKRQQLEQLPYVVHTKDIPLLITSGHHRIRAARAAGIREVYFILDLSDLTKDQIRAKQLAHNSLSGYDNPEILLRMFNEIEDIDSKIQAFIDPSLVELQIVSEPLIDSGSDIEFHHVALYFLPHEQEKFESMIKQLPDDVNTVYVTNEEDFVQFKKLMNDLKQVHNIHSIGRGLVKMMELAQRTLEEEKNPQEKDSKVNNPEE